MQLKRTMLLACTTMSVGACTGDAAMDASLGSVLGSTAAFVTGDYDLAGQFATQGQHFYSMGQTGDYVYDAETAQSWTGTSSGSSTSTANQPGESGASGGNADTMEAVSSAVSLDYPASMGDLGPNIMAARPSSPCPADLSYLDSILPHTSDMELERTRANLLAADMTEAHFSPPEHVVQALDASDAFRQTADEAIATLQQISSAPEYVLEQVRGGTYPMNDGMEGSTVRALVAAWYGMIGAREMAVTIACYIAT